MKIAFYIVTVLSLIPIASLAVDDSTEEKSPWERSIALGYNKQSGNTDKSAFKGNLGVKWDVQKMRWSLDASMDYGKADGEKDVDKGTAGTEYRYKYTKRLYANAFASAKYDKMADLDYRYIPGIGAGYTFYKSDLQEVSGSIGPTYLMEKYSDGRRNDYWGAQVTADYHIKFKQGSKLWALGGYNVRVDDSDMYLLNGEIGAEAPLGYGFGIRLVLTDSYNNRPAEDKKKNDVTISSGISFSF